MIRILSMTATFGKLNNETLELSPGLDIHTAPNEWGKTTWCAFFLAMLYGIDTSQRAKAGVVPDKERYKPWSGAPMEGRMELNWDGRGITIQRQTRGRTPMGVFRAWETATGAAVPELNGENCGLKLLGVERSVFVRSAFIRQADFPVTKDDDLLRRLNALVTTGDGSTAGPALARHLRDLKNRCRFNKTGLLPQAEQKRRELGERIAQMDRLEAAESQARGQLQELKEQEDRLTGHLNYLDSMDAQSRQAQLEAVQAAEAKALAELQSREADCEDLPSRQETQLALEALERREQQLHSLEMEAAMLGPAPEPPQAPEPFRGKSPEEAQAAVQQLAKEAAALRSRHGRLPWILLILGLVLLAAGVGAALGVSAAFWLLAGLGAIVSGIGCVLALAQRRAGARYDALLAPYGSIDAARALVGDYIQRQEAYDRRLSQWQVHCHDIDQRRKALEKDAPPRKREELEEILAKWNLAEDARRTWVSASGHARDMAALAGQPPEAQAPDVGLTLTREEARRQLADVRLRAGSLRRQADQSQGQRLGLGDRDMLCAQAEALDRRIAKLEDVYAAACYGLAALEAAEQDLRSRFAPKIAAQARDFLARLTGGRYEQLLLEQDLSLTVAAREETTLRPARLRSDGTVDQIYFALRLAVAHALLPEGTPLILDDALQRFDDDRLAAALALLREEARERQVVLFTCQGRERALMNAGEEANG